MLGYRYPRGDDRFDAESVAFPRKNKERTKWRDFEIRVRAGGPIKEKYLSALRKKSKP